MYIIVVWFKLSRKFNPHHGLVRKTNRSFTPVWSWRCECYSILVRQYQKPIFNLMYRVTGSSEDAKDLTQETFIKAYEKLDHFRMGARFFPWLYTIGYNHARNFVQRGKPFSAIERRRVSKNTQWILSFSAGRKGVGADRLPAYFIRPLSSSPWITGRLSFFITMRGFRWRISRRPFSFPSVERK